MSTSSGGTPTCASPAGSPSSQSASHPQRPAGPTPVSTRMSVPAERIRYDVHGTSHLLSRKSDG